MINSKRRRYNIVRTDQNDRKSNSAKKICYLSIGESEDQQNQNNTCLINNIKGENGNNIETLFEINLNAPPNNTENLSNSEANNTRTVHPISVNSPKTAFFDKLSIQNFHFFTQDHDLYPRRIDESNIEKPDQYFSMNLSHQCEDLSSKNRMENFCFEKLNLSLNREMYDPLLPKGYDNFSKLQKNNFYSSIFEDSNYLQYVRNLIGNMDNRKKGIEQDFNGQKRNLGNNSSGIENSNKKYLISEKNNFGNNEIEDFKENTKNKIFNSNEFTNSSFNKAFEKNHHLFNFFFGKLYFDTKHLENKLFLANLNNFTIKGILNNLITNMTLSNNKGINMEMRLTVYKNFYDSLNMHNSNFIYFMNEIQRLNIEFNTLLNNLNLFPNNYSKNAINKDSNIDSQNSKPIWDYENFMNFLKTKNLENLHDFDNDKNLNLEKQSKLKLQNTKDLNVKELQQSLEFPIQKNQQTLLNSQSQKSNHAIFSCNNINNNNFNFFSKDSQYLNRNSVKLDDILTGFPQHAPFTFKTEKENKDTPKLRENIKRDKNVRRRFEIKNAIKFFKKLIKLCGKIKIRKMNKIKFSENHYKNDLNDINKFFIFINLKQRLNNFKGYICKLKLKSKTMIDYVENIFKYEKILDNDDIFNKNKKYKRLITADKTFKNLKRKIFYFSKLIIICQDKEIKLANIKAELSKTFKSYFINEHNQTQCLNNLASNLNSLILDRTEEKNLRASIYLNSQDILKLKGYEDLRLKKREKERFRKENQYNNYNKIKPLNSNLGRDRNDSNKNFKDEDNNKNNCLNYNKNNFSDEENKFNNKIKIRIIDDNNINNPNDINTNSLYFRDSSNIVQNNNKINSFTTKNINFNALNKNKSQDIHNNLNPNSYKRANNSIKDYDMYSSYDRNSLYNISIEDQNNHILTTPNTNPIIIKIKKEEENNKESIDKNKIFLIYKEIKKEYQNRIIVKGASENLICPSFKKESNIYRKILCKLIDFIRGFIFLLMIKNKQKFYNSVGLPKYKIGIFSSLNKNNYSQKLNEKNRREKKDNKIENESENLLQQLENIIYLLDQREKEFNNRFFIGDNNIPFMNKESPSNVNKSDVDNPMNESLDNKRLTYSLCTSNLFNFPSNENLNFNFLKNKKSIKSQLINFIKNCKTENYIKLIESNHFKIKCQNQSQLNEYYKNILKNSIENMFYNKENKFTIEMCDRLIFDRLKTIPNIRLFLDMKIEDFINYIYKDSYFSQCVVENVKESYYYSETKYKKYLDLTETEINYIVNTFSTRKSSKNYLKGKDIYRQYNEFFREMPINKIFNEDFLDQRFKEYIKKNLLTNKFYKKNLMGPELGKINREKPIRFNDINNQILNKDKIRNNSKLTIESQNSLDIQKKKDFLKDEFENTKKYKFRKHYFFNFKGNYTKQKYRKIHKKFFKIIYNQIISNKIHFKKCFTEYIKIMRNNELYIRIFEKINNNFSTILKNTQSYKKN